MDKMPESHILVTASVSEEAEGIKRRLTSPEQKNIGGRFLVEGNIGSVPVRLLETGPGLVNTAQSLAAAIEARTPAMLLMIGCAGGFRKAGVNVGDICIATEENDVHLGVEAEGENRAPAPLPFDLAFVDGVSIKHRIPLDHRLSNSALDILREGFGDPAISVHQGPFVTVATITATDPGADRIYDRFRPFMENMEGAAAALVAKHYGIPFLEIRCASNLVGKRDRRRWDLPLACRRSAEAAVMWILAQKSEQ